MAVDLHRLFATSPASNPQGQGTPLGEPIRPVLGILDLAGQQALTRLRALTDQVAGPAQPPQWESLRRPFSFFPGQSALPPEIEAPTPEVLAQERATAISPVLTQASIFPIPGGSLQEARITTPFGGSQARAAHWTGEIPQTHGGIDLAYSLGTPVQATRSARVKAAGSTGGPYGIWVVLDFGDGTEAIYGHLDTVFVRPGTFVAPGHLLGTVGTTGNSTGPHLHFEVRKDGKPIDPIPYMGGGA